MSRQDRQGARTPADLERKYDFEKRFVLNEKLDQNEVFNRLTNYGKSQGVFKDDDGNIYLNASYLVTGILKSQDGTTFYLDLVNGILKGQFTEFSISGKSVDDIAGDKVDSQSQEDIYNKLTNNGLSEGLYMVDGELYINASYLVSGVLKSKDGSTFYLDLSNNVLKADFSALSVGGNKVLTRANLLDNSDFSNPVNQRGETAYTANGYTVDRWANTYGSLTLYAGHVNWRSNSIGGAYKRLMQKMGRKLEAGKTYTLAMLARVNSVSGYVELRLARNNAAVSGASKRIKDTTTGFEWFVFSHALPDDVDVPGFDLLVNNTESDSLDIDIKAAAIYEGEYTADTLPEYQPKGYAAELAECRRYLYRLSASAAAVTVTGGNAGGQYSYFYLPLPVAMQGTGVPTLEHSGVDVYPFQSGGAVEITAFTTGILSSRNGVTIRATHATGVAAARDAMALRIGAGGYLAVNMEL